MGIWRCVSSLGSDVLVQIYGFQPFLLGLVAVIIQVANLVLWGVVQSHGPILNDWEVIEIVLC